MAKTKRKATWSLLPTTPGLLHQLTDNLATVRASGIETSVILVAKPGSRYNTF